MESQMSESPSNTAQPVPFINLTAQFQTIKDEVLDAVHRVFECQGFILGDEVSELETQVATYCDSQEAIGCASGTDALFLSLLGLEIGPGDEVITSPFTFFATAGAITRSGAKPVFVDIDPDTFNIDAAKVAAALTPKTRAIMPVHIFGQCADMEPLWRLAAQSGTSIIEDACQAIGAEYRGRRAGVLGTTGCFSFFPTKNLGAAGDGGIITTDDPQLAARLKRLRVHGDVGGYRHQDIGINSRLDALQAAVLRVKLAKLDEWTEARQKNANRYLEMFKDQGLQDVIGVSQLNPEDRHVYNQFTIRVKDGCRDAVMQSLRDQQIGCTIYYPTPLHLQACFGDLGYQPGQLPEAERAAAEVLSLPIFPELTEAQQDRVVVGLCTALGKTTDVPKTYAFPTEQRKAA
jgi:dTDP-4-amino-4,6-dideoxygalactose transaminase